MYILNICWVSRIDLIPKGTEQPVGLILPSKISHIVLQPIEIQKLVEYGATNRMIILPMLLLQFPREDKDREKR